MSYRTEMHVSERVFFFPRTCKSTMTYASVLARWDVFVREKKTSTEHKEELTWSDMFTV